MTTDNMFFRLPHGTKLRIQQLAKEHEPLSAVIIRALDALESMRDSTRDNEIADNRFDVIQSQLNELNDRLVAIELAGGGGVGEKKSLVMIE